MRTVGPIRYFSSPVLSAENRAFGWCAGVIRPKPKHRLSLFRSIGVTERTQQPKTKQVRIGLKKSWTTLFPGDFTYWERLHSFINNNPVHERDRFFMARLKLLSLSDATEELRSGHVYRDMSVVGPSLHFVP